jgi:hypothetical protein
VEHAVLESPQTHQVETESGPKPHSIATKRATREAYVAGEGAAHVLAERFNVPTDTVREWITDGNWRALRAERDEQERLALIAPIAPPVTVIPPLPPQPANAMLDEVNEQLARVDDMLRDSRDWKAVEALTRAKSRLFETWCVLTGHPRPGTRRVRSGRQSAPVAEPVGPAPALSPATPSTTPRPQVDATAHRQTPVSDTAPPALACDLLPGDGAGI